MSNQDNDFGFSAVDESQISGAIEHPKAINPNVEETLLDINAKLDTLIARTEPVPQNQDAALAERMQKIEKAIIPLLDNLMKDSEKKEYIHWPNRGPIIKNQIEKILSLTRG